MTTAATQAFDADGRPLPRLRMPSPERPLFVCGWAINGEPVRFGIAWNGELGGLAGLRDLLDKIIRRQRDYPPDTVRAAIEARELIRKADWSGLRALCFDWNRAEDDDK
jgi:hypothetical protein